jgi:methyl-accepting chemotaxis protein
MKIVYSNNPANYKVSEDDLLVIEKVVDNIKLTPINSKEYIFEGTFTKFGIKNKNGRIYEYKEFKPHLDSLIQQINSSSKLLGELDHPQDFEVKYSRVSHIIESLSYDEKTNTVRGRIRLLDTERGRDAKAIADAGVSLNISSRAAGRVREDDTVELQKVFTYDLVVDPGFKEAILTRVNENNVTDIKLKSIFESINNFEKESNLVLLNESFGLSKSDDFKIFKTAKINNNITENKNNSMNGSEQKYVTVEQLSDWSTKFTNQIQNILNKRVTESAGSYASADELTTIKNYLNQLTDNLNEFAQRFETVESTTNKMNSYLDKNSDTLNDLVSYIEDIAEKSEGLKLYIENIAEKGNILAAHNNHLSESGSKLQEFVEYLAKNVNLLAKYADKNNTETKLTNEYVEHSMKKVNKLAEYVNAFSEDYRDTVKGGKTQLTESAKYSSNKYKNDIGSKLDAILENAKKQEVETKKAIDILNYLDSNQKSLFATLSDSEKQCVSEQLVNNPSWLYNQENINQVLESVVFVQKPKSTVLNWLNNMPTQYKESWLRLSETQQYMIAEQAKYYNFDNSMKAIEDFWATRDLRPNKITFKAIDESKQISVKTKETSNTGIYENFDAEAKAIINSVKTIFRS